MQQTLGVVSPKFLLDHLAFLIDTSFYREYAQQGRKSSSLEWRRQTPLNCVVMIKPIRVHTFLNSVPPHVHPL